MGKRVLLTVRFLDGPLSNEIRAFSCSTRRVKAIGLSVGLKGRRWRIVHPRELFGFEFTIQFRRDGTGISMGEVSATSTQRSRNSTLKCRRLSKARRPCNRDVACYYCGKIDCVLSTHWDAWAFKDCQAGHNSVHDSEGCICCAEKEYEENDGELPETTDV